MGFGTTLWTTIYFNREMFCDIHDVKMKLKEAEEDLHRAKQQMRSLVFMTEPNKFFESDEEYSAFDALEYKYELVLEQLLEADFNVYKYSTLLEEWDKCHKDGKAVYPPKEMVRDAYMHGDFIEMVYEDGTKVE